MWPDWRNCRWARTLIASSAKLVASGHYTEPSTEAWRKQAYAGGLVIVVLGRTPVQPSTTPFELLFSAASRMGVIPLVAPGPL
jgi:hypothetical protein